jgi:hypothetical protein
MHESCAAEERPQTACSVASCVQRREYTRMGRGHATIFKIMYKKDPKVLHFMRQIAFAKVKQNINYATAKTMSLRHMRLGGMSDMTSQT